MHSLILGMTESGKTTLGKILIKIHKAQGGKSIVLDPLGDPEFSADFQTSDPGEFLKVFFNSRSCYVFIDESGDAIGHYNIEMSKTATKGRHYGHSCFYITQKITQIPPIVREQCGQVYMFASGVASCKLISEEFNSREFLNGSELKQGEFYQKGRFDKIKKGNIFEISDKMQL